jgi:ribonuclease D
MTSNKGKKGRRGGGRGDKSAKGLSELTRRCFGKQLDKSECLSNWERRPLRQAQLIYAALDAFVLIKIHDFIQERCRQLDVNFDYTTKYLI